MVKKKPYLILPSVICILLVILLAVSAVTAAAEEPAAPDVIAEPKVGFHFETPEKYRNLKGTLDWGAGYLDDGILQFTASYYAVSPENWDAYNAYFDEWLDALEKGEDLPEPPDPSWMSNREHAYLYEVFSMNGDRSLDDLHEELKYHNGARGDNFAWLEKIGSDGEYSFYVGQYQEFEEKKDEYREIMGEFFGEFEDLITDRESFLSALTLSAPEMEQQKLEEGNAISFETTDLDFNPVSSKELFAENKVTMINLWATWCHACKMELPELAEIAKEYEGKGCRIVGICLDADEEGLEEEAKEILKEAGVEYMNLIPPEGVEDLLPSISLPMTYFFDSEGKMIFDPIRGAHVDEYRPALDAALKQGGAV